MSKSEFLKILRRELGISLEANIVNEQIDYYDNYIANEMKNGKTEKQVLDELGDPRLIAKTIKTVNNADKIIDVNESNDYNNQTNTNTNYQNNNTSSKQYYDIKTTTVLGCVIVGLIIFIIIASIFKLFGGLLSFLLTGFMGPIGLMVIVIIAYMLFFGKGNRF